MPSEADHKYQFQGFPGTYWEKKAERERKAEETRCPATGQERNR